jgi:hypothetical protein
MFWASTNGGFDMNTPHRVTYAIDSLDPNPVVMEFDSEWEALEWLGDEMERRVSHIVEHSPYSVDEDELDAIRESETALCRIERV